MWDDVDLLCDINQEFDFGWTEGQRAALLRYAALVEKGQKETNLVGFKSSRRFWYEAIVDACLVGRWILGRTSADDGKEGWADIGSGSGLPGIPWLIMGVGVTQFWEPRRLRARFISDALRQLGWAKVEVVAQSLVWGEDRVGCLVSRAVWPPEKIIENIRRFQPLGRLPAKRMVFLWSSRDLDNNIKQLQRLGEFCTFLYKIPGLDQERVALDFTLKS
jgi:16S rRNA G527 N7-methylase RsmG